MPRVAKFGGSSLANSDQIQKVIKIIRIPSERDYIVVSAPGKIKDTDQKITDLLIEWHRLHQLHLSMSEVRGLIYDRFASIVRAFNLNLDVQAEINIIGKQIEAGASVDYAASRGEYLMAKILAEAIGYEFVDATELISFDENGRYVKNPDRISEKLWHKKAVIPGFYGRLPSGEIKTFSRGGSDLTGALIAEGVRASLYENWTDTVMRMADPRIVDNPKQIGWMTYEEMRELAYMGASIFHEEAMFPVREANITTEIRNTNDPSRYGTQLIFKGPSIGVTEAITGIAGRRNFSIFKVDKALMNNEVGYLRRILSIFEHEGVSVEHMPTGIDKVSIIVDTALLKDKAEMIFEKIQCECSPDNVMVDHDLALIAVVGQGMNHRYGIAAKIFGALAEQGINVRTINQGASETSIIIGVANADYEKAIRALYQQFVPK